jgi:hypothetical protein
VGAYYVANVATDTTVVTTAETVLATVAGITSQRPGQRVSLHGHVNITMGTSTTGIVLRVREDTLTGALVDEIETETLGGAVAVPEDHDIDCEHVPTGELSGKSYVLTVVQTAASANGTVNHAKLEATTYP